MLCIFYSRFVSKITLYMNSPTESLKLSTPRQILQLKYADILANLAPEMNYHLQPLFGHSKKKQMKSCRE